MKELEEDYHLEVRLYCSECAGKEYRPWLKENFHPTAGLRRYDEKYEELVEKYRMGNYSHAHGKWRFECRTCGKCIQVNAMELENQWER